MYYLKFLDDPENEISKYINFLSVDLIKNLLEVHIDQPKTIPELYTKIKSTIASPCTITLEFLDQNQKTYATQTFRANLKQHVFDVVYSLENPMTHIILFDLDSVNPSIL